MSCARHLLAACTVGVLLSASTVRAQQPQFSLGAGVAVPLGDFDDVVKLGWQGTGGVSFLLRGVPVGIQVNASYSQFPDETPFDIKNQLIYGTADAVYRFQSDISTRFHPYVLAGAGVYHAKETGTDALGGSSTNLGVNAGAGVDFRAGTAELFLEGRFHNVFSDGPNVKFVPINLGIRFGGR